MRFTFLPRNAFLACHMSKLPCMAYQGRASCRAPWTAAGHAGADARRAGQHPRQRHAVHPEFLGGIGYADIAQPLRQDLSRMGNWTTRSWPRRSRRCGRSRFAAARPARTIPAGADLSYRLLLAGSPVPTAVRNPCSSRLSSHTCVHRSDERFAAALRRDPVCD
jgi:hypothetical protein